MRMSSNTQPITGPIPAAVEEDVLKRPRTSLFQDTIRRLLRNKVATVSGLYILLIALAAILAPLITPYPYDETDYSNVLGKPNAEHIFGADELGRDVFSRLIFGSRVSLGVAFVGSLTAMLIGVLYGAVAGYLGGWIDDLMMRFVDLMYGFPVLLFVILVMLIIPPNSPPGLIMVGVFVSLGVVSWLGVSRLVRGQFLSLRQKEFVEAARATGATPWRIIWRHLLPNSLGPVIVWLTLQIPNLILTESTLSFIGLGVQEPLSSWGKMLSDGWRSMRSAPHMAVFPALAIMITMLAFNFFGDGLRDALDPTMRGRD
ncbi:MAG: ABC transporter permease [Anaerolineae bacterium]|nr:ABC transporter permease [Anaerolineae bacterium]